MARTVIEATKIIDEHTGEEVNIAVSVDKFSIQDVHLKTCDPKIPLIVLVNSSYGDYKYTIELKPCRYFTTIAGFFSYIQTSDVIIFLTDKALSVKVVVSGDIFVHKSSLHNSYYTVLSWKDNSWIECLEYSNTGKLFTPVTQEFLLNECEFIGNCKEVPQVDSGVNSIIDFIEQNK